ncbi:MAG TPA: hypothetical protein VF538_00415 [Pyrinomonadaceae bacterium]|jgi:hypothetical protein
MKAVLVEKKEVYVRCPDCGDENSHHVTHLDPGTSFGPSYCGNCGAGVRGYLSGDGSVEIFETGDRKEQTYVLLRISPQDDPIYLVVRGAEFVTDDGAGMVEECEEETFFESDEYFYGYTCHPSVTLRTAVAVIINGEADPHGIFEYVATRPALSAHEYAEARIPDSLLVEFLRLTGQTHVSAVEVTDSDSI